MWVKQVVRISDQNDPIIHNDCNIDIDGFAITLWETRSSWTLVGAIVDIITSDPKDDFHLKFGVCVDSPYIKYEFWKISFGNKETYLDRM